MGQRDSKPEAIGTSGRGKNQASRTAPVRHLSQEQLAQRLGVSERTIEGWRYRGKGPDYLRLEGRIAYRLADVERFELERLHESSAKPCEARR